MEVPMSHGGDGGKVKAVRAVVRDLLSNPAVDVSAGQPTAEVVENILAWAQHLRNSREAHARLGQELSEDCVALRIQFESLLVSLGLKPADLNTAAGSTAVVEHLMALVADESEQWDSVKIDPANDSVDAPGPVPRTFSYTVKSRGVLKLRLCNAASVSAYVPQALGLRSGPALIDLKIHREYAVEGASRVAEVEKLPVEYKCSVGLSPWKRAWGGAIFAFLHSDFATAQDDNDSFLFSKHLRIEDEHAYLLDAKPGDHFVCEVTPREGSPPVTLETSFLDMKLAGALEQLDAAHQAFSSHSMVSIDGIVDRVEGLRQLTISHALARDELVVQEAELATVRGNIAGMEAKLLEIPAIVAARLATEVEARETARDEFVAQRLVAERTKLERLIAEAVANVERSFHADETADLASPGAEDRAEVRAQRLATEKASLEAVLAERRAALAEARATLRTVETAAVTEDARLRELLAKSTVEQDVAAAGKLQRARLSMKQLIYDRTEKEVTGLLAEHHDALDAAVRMRRDAIRAVRGLPHQDSVRGLLAQWDYRGANAKLSPFL